MKSEKVVDILLVEDSLADVRMAREALKEGKINNQLSVVEDGEKAMRYLRREGEFANAARPDMILLDMNLPRKDGREVLDEISADPGLKSIPLVILTGSTLDKQILERYGVKAQCWIVKPLDLMRYLEAVKCFSNFSLTIMTRAAGA